MVEISAADKEAAKYSYGVQHIHVGICRKHLIEVLIDGCLSMGCPSRTRTQCVNQHANKEKGPVNS